MTLVSSFLSDDNNYLFVRSLLRENILVRPKYMGSNYKDAILILLKRSVEGVCTHHGYILEGSTFLKRVHSGRVEANSFNGDIVFNVQFTAMVCNPPIGMLLKARVVNVNMFAVFTNVGVSTSTGEFLPVIDAIIVKAQHTGDVLEELNGMQVGHTVYVEIIGKRFEISDRRISVIGRYNPDQQKEAYERMLADFNGGNLVHRTTSKVGAVDMPQYVKSAEATTPIAALSRLKHEGISSSLTARNGASTRRHAPPSATEFEDDEEDGALGSGDEVATDESESDGGVGELEDDADVESDGGVVDTVEDDEDDSDDKDDEDAAIDDPAEDDLDEEDSISDVEFSS